MLVADWLQCRGLNTHCGPSMPVHGAAGLQHTPESHRSAQQPAHLEEARCWVYLAPPILGAAMPHNRELQGCEQAVGGLDCPALTSLSHTLGHPLPALVLPVVSEDPGWTADA